MISLRDLKDSIYRDCYFTEVSHSIRVTNEENPSATPVLKCVDLHTSGTFIQIANGLLKEGADIFQKEDKKKGRISFRRDCDGICFWDANDGRRLLLFSEVKSGFNLIKEKGFEQLVASYIKIRCLLHTIDTYQSKDIEEIALLFSYPPQSKPEITNKDVFASKTQIVAPSSIDTANNRYATALRVDHEATIDLYDYHVNQCHINPSLYNRTLKVIHVTVENAAESHVLDLDSLIF